MCQSLPLCRKFSVLEMIHGKNVDSTVAKHYPEESGAQNVNQMKVISVGLNVHGRVLKLEKNWLFCYFTSFLFTLNILPHVTNRYFQTLSRSGKGS